MMRVRSFGSTAAAAAGARSASSACSAAGAALVELGGDPLAHSGRRRRAQLQVGERGLEIEPGAAHDDRAAPVGERRVDLGVRQRGELPRREALADRHE